MKKVFLILFVFVVLSTTNIFAAIWFDANAGFAFGYENFIPLGSNTDNVVSHSFSLGIPTIQLGAGFDWFGDNSFAASTVLLDGDFMLCFGSNLGLAGHLGILHEFVYKSPNPNLWGVTGIGAGYYFRDNSDQLGYVYLKLEPGVVLYDKVKLSVSFMPYFANETYAGFDIAFRIYFRNDLLIPFFKGILDGLSSAQSQM